MYGFKINLYYQSIMQYSDTDKYVFHSVTVDRKLINFRVSYQSLLDKKINNIQITQQIG